ncbi:MAG: uroporphyrinogen decarboxylase family protein, partial [Candidatus Hodarchaeota archaeon]
MDCRERVLTTLNLEEPDRVPCHTILIDANNVDKILGKPQISDFDTLEQIKQENPDNWAEEISNLIEKVETSIFSRCVEAAAAIGLDCMQVGIVPVEFIDDPNDDRDLLRDIFGRIWEARDNEGNFNPYYLYGTMNSPEKWEEIKENIEGPMTEKYTKMVKKFYRRINKKHKDKIFVAVTNDLAGVFESASQGMGMTYYSRMLHKNPRFIKEVHEVIAEFTAACYRSYMEVGAEVFIESGDLAYHSGPMMSPKKFNDLLLPAYQIITDAVHEGGGKIVLHTDGQITPLLDFVVDCGFDGLHSLEPTAGVDLALVKKKVGDKICLMGNIDIAHILTYGTKEEVFEAVKYAIRVAGPGGGFIVSAANMHPYVKVPNLRWMVEATREFGSYPLNL